MAEIFSFVQARNQRSVRSAFVEAIFDRRPVSLLSNRYTMKYGM